MLKNIILCLGVFISSTAFSQIKLTGKITDSGGNPISFATVQLVKPDSSLSASEIAKEDGNFMLSVKPGSYRLKINQMGQLLFDKSLYLKLDTNVGTLSSKVVNQLSTVVISGTKPIITQEFDKLIFSVENSPLKSGYNGLDVLARTPRLNVNSAGEVLLRNSRPLIMINGRKQNLSGEELMSYLMSLDANMIKAIEIQSSGSASSDAEATAGVVNIILKKAPLSFTSTFTSSYTYRKDNIWSGYTGLNNNYGSEKLNFYSKIDFRKDNDFARYKIDKNFNDGSRSQAIGSLNGKKENASLLGGLVFYPNKKHQFGIEFYYSHNTGDFVIPENLSVFNPALSSVSYNKRTENSKRNIWYTTANYTFLLDTLGSKLKFIGDFGENRNTADNYTNTTYSFGSFPDNQVRYLAAPFSKYYNIQGDWIKKFKNQMEFNSGLKFGSVRRNNLLETNVLTEKDWNTPEDLQESFNNRENILAAYISGSFTPWEKHTIKAGLRVENTEFTGKNELTGVKVNQKYTGFFPTLYYGYTLAENKILSLTYSRSILRPSFRDLNPFIRKESDYSYIMGNPDLKPQYTNKLELTYQLSHHALTAYAVFNNDFIAGVYSSQGSVTYYKPMNFGKDLQTGLDYNYYGDITKWLYANISGGAYYYKFQQRSLQPSQIAFIGNFYMKAKLSKTWSLDVTNYLNSRFQTYVVSVSPQYRLDLLIQKTLWSGRSSLRLSCVDVFNTQRDMNRSTYSGFNLNFYQKRNSRAYTLMFIYNINTKQKPKNESVESDNQTQNRL